MHTPKYLFVLTLPLLLAACASPKEEALVSAPADAPPAAESLEGAWKGTCVASTRGGYARNELTINLASQSRLGAPSYHDANCTSPQGPQNAVIPTHTVQLVLDSINGNSYLRLTDTGRTYYYSYTLAPGRLSLQQVSPTPSGVVSVGALLTYTR